MSENESGVLDAAAFERLREFGGDEVVDAVLEEFRSNGPVYLRAIGPAASDLAEALRAAHLLKTSAAYVGAGRLRELAERAEAQADAGERDALAETFARLQEEFEIVEPKLPGGGAPSN